MSPAQSNSMANWVQKLGVPTVALAVIAWWMAPRFDKLLDRHLDFVDRTADLIAEQVEIEKEQTAILKELVSIQKERFAGPPMRRDGVQVGRVSVNGGS